MNRADRLLAIVLELQAAGWRRAEDLARTFEVGKRAIYRDIQALREAGVPVVSTPGQGYSLVEGYFLPPLRITAGAALMLLGGDLMADSFDAEYRADARSPGCCPSTRATRCARCEKASASWPKARARARTIRCASRGAPSRRGRVYAAQLPRSAVDRPTPCPSPFQGRRFIF